MDECVKDGQKYRSEISDRFLLVSLLFSSVDRRPEFKEIIMVVFPLQVGQSFIQEHLVS